MQPNHDLSRSLWLPLSVLAFLWSACATTEANIDSQVSSLVTHGRYEEAVREAADLAAKNPGDQAAQQLHRAATVAYMLEEGRRLTFRDEDTQALQIFLDAQKVDPESRTVLAWIEKTRRKLAQRWLEAALELHAGDKLEAAVEAYDNALKFEPGLRSAITGYYEATLLINYRAGLGQSYYEEGLRRLRESWLEQAKSRFVNSEKYQPKDERTVERRGEVQVLLAAQRVIVAGQLEKKLKFDAARNEYRLAMVLDPDNAEAKVGRERCTEEAHAAELLRQGKMEIVRGRFDKAQKLFEEGAPLTKQQQELFEGALTGLAEARNEKSYQSALSLEHDYRFEEAIVKYSELLKETPYFKDTLTRRDTLQSYVDKAVELYDKAGAESEPEKKATYLRQISVFWPEYKDVAEQLKSLQKPQ